MKKNIKKIIIIFFPYIFEIAIRISVIGHLLRKFISLTKNPYLFKKCKNATKYSNEEFAVLFYKTDNTQNFYKNMSNILYKNERNILNELLVTNNKNVL